MGMAIILPDINWLCENSCFTGFLGQAGMPDLRILLYYICREGTCSIPIIEKIASTRMGLAMTVMFLIESSVGAICL